MTCKDLPTIDTACLTKKLLLLEILAYCSVLSYSIRTRELKLEAIKKHFCCIAVDKTNKKIKTNRETDMFANCILIFRSVWVCLGSMLSFDFLVAFQSVKC